MTVSPVAPGTAYASTPVMAARNLAEILIRAVDQTRGAFNSIRENLRRLGSEAGRLGGILAGLGAGLSAASFAAMIKGSIDAADELNKLSQKIGISVEALSTLRFAADLSDVSLETLQSGIKKLSQGITEASTGTGKAAGDRRRGDPGQAGLAVCR